MSERRNTRNRDRQAIGTTKRSSSIAHQSGSTLQIHLSKLVQIQFAQCLHRLIEYASELTYFAINVFQTSSLRRVQMNTLRRFNELTVPRACAFYYNLDTDFDDFIKKMRFLCGFAKRTFLDLRMARIHFPEGRMVNLPIIRRTMDIFQCNINRLRDLKEIHQDIDSKLLVPNDQLYLALDLLQTDFQLLNCELDNQVKFADAILLQTVIRGDDKTMVHLDQLTNESFDLDIFLQIRLVLTGIVPVVKNAAYRPDDKMLCQTKKIKWKNRNHPLCHEYRLKRRN